MLDTRAALRDIALGGVFVSTVRPAAVGSSVWLRFGTGAEATCEASGRVVWRTDEDERSGFGVSFETVNEELRDFVRELERVAPGSGRDWLARFVDPRVEVDEITPRVRPARRPMPRR